ncbi:MAG: hypothetical protein ABJA80_16800 [bacterium]
MGGGEGAGASGRGSGNDDGRAANGPAGGTPPGRGPGGGDDGRANGAGTGPGPCGERGAPNGGGAEVGRANGAFEAGGAPEGATGVFRGDCVAGANTAAGDTDGVVGRGGIAVCDGNGGGTGTDDAAGVGAEVAHG